LLAAIPIVAGIFLGPVRGWHLATFYLPFLVLCYLLFQFGKSRAGQTLMVFSLMVVALLAVAIMAGGRLAMWCIIGVGLFTSIGWSNTFSLAIEGTGVYKSQASSLLVMAILGGALLPPAQGYIADRASLQLSYLVPLLAYAYVAFYGWKGHLFKRMN
jgi:FHS family L-fucose permease-like MFS transporter